MAKVTNPGVDEVNVPAFGLAIPAGASVEVADDVAAALADGPLTVEGFTPPQQTPPEQASDVPVTPVQEAQTAPEAPKEQG